MAAHAVSPKSARVAVTVPEDSDLEQRNRDHGRVDPSGSSRSIRDERHSPTFRASLEIDDDNINHHHHHHQQERPPESVPWWRRRIQGKTPKPAVRYWNTVVAWVEGPKPRQIHRISPLLERWQTLPIRVLGRLPQWARILIYGIVCILWTVVFGVVINDYSLPPSIAGAGSPVRLSCVDNLWPSPQVCGLDGRNCFPFSNYTFAFNCPADCVSAQVLNPRSIGSTIIDYRSLVVGGAPDPFANQEVIYRGDSFICGAAIHAGVISNGKGGCGILSLEGERASFGEINRNGISSIGFDSAFPMSFVFKPTSAIKSASSQCHDPRWILLIPSTVFTVIFGVFTTKAATFFIPIFTILFFQVGMASDPPSYTTSVSLASTIIGRFLPAALGAAVFYQWSIRKTLRNCRASVEKTVLWVGGAWVGALANSTLEKIPIQRLTGHDIRQQPGAITALIIIVIVLFAVMLYQAACFRQEGRLPRLLALYAVIGVGLGILAALPQLNLRIHHYIIALLLLPSTALQTRVSLFCQGLLVGLYVNGTARWGFDSILQTAAALRGDAQLGSPIPSMLDPVINGTSITFAWKAALHGYDGVSVLVNDVERLRGGLGENETSYTWMRQAEDASEYFRFGFISYQPFGGVAYSDFTKAGIWWPNGTWDEFPPGRT